jgi:serine/threonine protein kinase
MARPIDASRDLLLGLLALQNGMVTRDQLVTAFGVWTVRPAETLAELLIEQGALRAEHRTLLDALASAHLGMHGGDPERSLGALEVSRSTREWLAAAGGSDVEASLAHVGIGSTEPAGEPTASYSVGEATSGGQRFRILRPHARGGLGAVFVALDSELKREVALKQILDGHADDPVSRQRFLIEAEITGGLEHPGIVPVYGLGSYGDGRPFYAMRFVKGDSLKQAVARFHSEAALRADAGARSLELRKLLRRFTDVCYAIAYAHSRGVLHRDIKPGNVMVGRYGETLVVDWGLAKALGRVGDGVGDEPATTDGERPLLPASASGSAQTLPGTALGTPGFMSPEQARGDFDALGPRSDVYSLGATLYCLLTGKPPVEGGDVGSVLRRVQAGEFPAPRTVSPSIDPALEKVCLAAMANRPADRYESARALAEDVERWLADEPVSVYRESTGQRLARWARRHRAWVQAATASLVVVALITTVTAILIGRAYSHERKARDDERAAKENAQAHFANARQATNDLYLTASKVLPTIPATENLRAQLAIKTAKLFDEFLKLRPDDRVVQREAARAQRELGNVFRLFGKFELARDGYTRAVALLEGLVAAAPADSLPLSDLVLTKADQGDLLRLWGKTTEARAVLQSALTLCPPLRNLAPGRPEALRGEAYVLIDWAALLLDLGREAEALDSSSRALAIAAQLGASDHLARDPSIAILAQVQAGKALSELGKDADARKRFDDALILTKDLIQRLPPNDPDARVLEAIVLIERGELVHAQAALEDDQRAFEIMDKLQREHPKIPGHVSNLALALNGRGRAQLEAKDLDKARQDCERARDHLKRLCELMPDKLPEQPGYRRDLGRVLANLARIAHAQSDDARARDLYRQASTQHEQILKQDPESVPDQRLLERARKEYQALEN